MIVCGVVLFVLSWTWLSITSSKNLWSDEQAKAYANASLKFHQLAHQNLHQKQQGASRLQGQDGHLLQVPDAPDPHGEEDHAGASSQDLAKAKNQYRKLRQQLDHARNRRKNAPWFLSTLGISLITAGCLLLLVTRKAV
jgi:hypothetical protein